MTNSKTETGKGFSYCIFDETAQLVTNSESRFVMHTKFQFIECRFETIVKQ